jgi:hypothetical protein
VARNNLFWIKGGYRRVITTTLIWIQSMSNIHLCLVNLYLIIKGVVVAAAVKGLRVCVHGPLIESRST